MPVSRNERIALSNLKRAAHDAIVVAKKVDRGERISSAQFDQIVTHLSEITEAVAVLGGEIGNA